MLVRGQCRGSLVVVSADPNRRFSSRDKTMLSIIGSQAGIALEQVRLYQLAIRQMDQLMKTKNRLSRRSEELQLALSRIVELQERERSRIAADMHDSVVQLMMGSLFELEAAIAAVSNAPEHVKEMQGKARRLFRQAVDETRRVIFDLRPLILDRAGLAPAVEWLSDYALKTDSVNPNLHVIGSPDRLLSQLETAISRIIQESVNNAIKHSEATSIDILVKFTRDHIEIKVTDNGKGFPSNWSIPKGGYRAGLIGVEERAKSVGGKVSISSISGKGTTVYGCFPGRLKGAKISSKEEVS